MNVSRVRCGGVGRAETDSSTLVDARWTRRRHSPHGPLDASALLYHLRQDGRRVLTIKIYLSRCQGFAAPPPSKFADQNLRWPGSKPVLWPSASPGGRWRANCGTDTGTPHGSHLIGHKYTTQKKESLPLSRHGSAATSSSGPPRNAGSAGSAGSRAQVLRPTHAK